MLKRIHRADLQGGGQPYLCSPREFTPNFDIKSAFTMAEVLITLGIIGIVIAMTLPGLLGRYQERVTITKLKQTYSILSQAFSMAISEYGTIENWCNIDEGREVCADIIKERAGKYIKKVLDCNSAWKKACFAGGYGNRFNNGVIGGYGQTAFVMANGVSVSIKASNGDGFTGSWCAGNIRQGGYQNVCGYIYVDINAQGGPNIDGRDFFAFKIYRDGIVPQGEEKNNVWVETFENQCLGKGYYNGSAACTAWVLYNENMDYLHCDDLSWDGKRKCGR